MERPAFCRLPKDFQRQQVANQTRIPGTRDLPGVWQPTAAASGHSTYYEQGNSPSSSPIPGSVQTVSGYPIAHVSRYYAF